LPFDCTNFKQNYEFICRIPSPFPYQMAEFTTFIAPRTPNGSIAKRLSNKKVYCIILRAVSSRVSAKNFERKTHILCFPVTWFPFNNFWHNPRIARKVIVSLSNNKTIFTLGNNLTPRVIRDNFFSFFPPQISVKIIP
jgi:hypothetical protein